MNRKKFISMSFMDDLLINELWWFFIASNWIFFITIFFYPWFIFLPLFRSPTLYCWQRIIVRPSNRFVYYKLSCEVFACIEVIDCLFTPLWSLVWSLSFFETVRQIRAWYQFSEQCKKGKNRKFLLSTGTEWNLCASWRNYVRLLKVSFFAKGSHFIYEQT